MGILGGFSNQRIEMLKFREQIFRRSAGLHGFFAFPDADECVFVLFRRVLEDECIFKASLYACAGKHPISNEVERFLFATRVKGNPGHFCVHGTILCLFLENKPKTRYTHDEGFNTYICILIYCMIDLQDATKNGKEAAIPYFSLFGSRG
jgi:hypothetical protein